MNSAKNNPSTALPNGQFSCSTTPSSSSIRLAAGAADGAGSAARQPEPRADELEGLVLSVQDYKENDGIVKLALPDRIVSVYARGVLKSTSKNRRLCTPFSKVLLIYEPKYSREMYYLIHGSVIWYDSAIQSDLLGQSVCFVLRDLLIRIGINPLIYHCLEQCWHCWNDKDPEGGYLYACLVLANLLKLAGLAPNLNECVLCGAKSGIETLVLSEGGYVCKNCRQPDWPKMDKQDLLAWRALFRAKADHIDYLQEHFVYTLEDVIFLARFWEYHAQSRLASVSFLETVAKMGT